MHPIFNVPRRRAGEKKILEQLQLKSGLSTLTDAARVDRNRYVAVAVSEQGTLLSACSVKAASPAIAEQVSLALGLLDSTRFHIYSDSRSAVRAFACGRVSPLVSRILRGRTITPHEITSFPAHVGSTIGGITNSNELAHAWARGLSRRASQP